MASLTSTTGKWLDTNGNVATLVSQLRANIASGQTISVTHIDDLQRLVTALWGHTHTTNDYVSKQEYGDGRNGDSIGLSPTYVYPNGSTDNLYVAFLNSYSVWDSAGNYYWVVNFASTNTYTFYFAADDYGDMYLDGQVILSLASGADNYKIGRSVALTVQAGYHIVRIDAKNAAGKAAIGGYIKNAVNTTIWTTRSQIDPASTGALGGTNQTTGTITVGNKTTSNVLVNGTQAGQTLTLEYAVPGTYTLAIPPGAKVTGLVIGAGGGGAGGDWSSNIAPIGGGGGSGGYYGSTNSALNNVQPIDVATATITTNLVSGNWYDAVGIGSNRPSWNTDMQNYSVWSASRATAGSELVSQRTFYAPYTGTYYITGGADSTLEVTIQGNTYTASSGHILAYNSATGYASNWKAITLQAGAIPLIFTSRVAATDPYAGFFLLIADSTGKNGRPGTGTGPNTVNNIIWKPKDYLTATTYDVVSKPDWYPVTNSGWSNWMNTYAVWPKPYNETYTSYWMKQDIVLPYEDTYTFEYLQDDVFYLYRYNTDNSYAGYVFTSGSWTAYQQTPNTTKVKLPGGLNSFAFYCINWPGPGGFALVIKDSRGAVIWTTRTPVTAVNAVADTQETDYVTTGDTLTIQVGEGGAGGDVRTNGSDGGDTFVQVASSNRKYYGFGGKGGKIRGVGGFGGNNAANLAVGVSGFGNTVISYTLGVGGQGGIGGVTGGGTGATAYNVAKNGAPRTGGGAGAGGGFTDDKGVAAGAKGGSGSLYTQTSDSHIAGPGGGGGGAGGVGYVNRGSWANLGTDDGLIAYYVTSPAGGIWKDSSIAGNLSATLGAGASAQVMPDTGFPAVKFTAASNSFAKVADTSALRLANVTTSSFTIEAWVYASGAGSAGTWGGEIVNKDSEYEIARMSDGRVILAIDWGLGIDVGLPGGGWILTTAYIPLKQATHVATVIDGTEAHVYINGVRQWSASKEGYLNNAGTTRYYALDRKYRNDGKPFYIGGRDGASQQWDGYIAGVRIWNVARTAQQIADHTYSLAKTGGFGGSYQGSGFFTGASFYFDGTAESISAAGTNGSFQLLDDFTVECWFNQVSRDGYNTLFEMGLYTNGILVRPGVQEEKTVWINGSVVGTFTSNIALQEWNHFAISRTGTTVKMHLNGKLQATATVSGTINSNNGALKIGSSAHTTGQHFNGYVTNFRVVKGKAVYTQDTFTAPIAPLSNILGTTFLGVQRNLLSDMGPFNIPVTSAGNVKPDTFSPFQSGARVYDEYSAFFDGNGDYVTVPYAQQFSHPTKFTIEMWLYPNSYNTSDNGSWNSLITRRPNGSYYAPYVIGLRNGKVQAYMSTTGSSWNLGPAETDALFQTPGTYEWTCPPGVDYVSVVCVGGGGSGYQGPYDGVAGGDSYFISPTTVKGGGGGGGTASGGGAAGTYTGDGGGQGGYGGHGFEGGGGGAGGYTGPGGSGSVRPNNSTAGAGGAGSGGVGSNGATGGGGGGTHVYGTGSTGTGQTYTGSDIGQSGLGGSGGNNGNAYASEVGNWYYAGGWGCWPGYWYWVGRTVYNSTGGFPGGGAGGDFSGWGGGGGGLAWKNSIAVVPGRKYTVVVGAGGFQSSSSNSSRGANGAVRIIWPGNTRSFPSTNTQHIPAAAANDGGPNGGIKSAQVLPLKQWTHVAITRHNQDVTLWIDGKFGAAGHLSDNNPTWNPGWPTVIGAIGYTPGSNGYYYDGYISNLRITNGVALYQDHFGVPTGPLPRVGGTGLLTFQDPTFKDKADNRTNMTVFGDAKMQTFSPFQQVNTGAAAYFDGDGDYCAVNQDEFDTSFQFANISFTVEGWMNTTKGPVGGLSANATAGANIANVTISNTTAYSSLISCWAPVVSAAETNYTLPGEHLWVCPPGVYSVSVLAIGGGASGYTRAGIVAGQDSYFGSPTTVCGKGANVGYLGGNWVGSGGGIGGAGGIGPNSGGGGAGGYSGAGGNGGGSTGLVASEQVFDTPGTYTWVCPAGVTSISVAAVGGGGSGGAAYWSGGGGGGGGLGYKNNITVVPGQSYTVVVGAGGVAVSASSGGQGTAGGDSYFGSASTVKGAGGAAGAGTSSNTNTQYAGGTGGGYVGDGGGAGGAGGTSYNDTPGGGGGAGGYAGTGGRGGSAYLGAFTSGTGGAAAGGQYGGNNAANGAAQSGGGTGLYGQALSGTAAGAGGSGGTNGSPNLTAGGSANTGGWPGGGGGGQSNDSKSTPGCNGAGGAVRIIWPGTDRAFPTTATGKIEQLSGVSAEQLYTTPGTYSWTCPPGVYSVDVLTVGAGASGDMGSGIVAGGGSYFGSTSTVYALGGAANGAGGTVSAGTGGAGGAGGTGTYAGGGGAGGYSGVGGAGGGSTSGSVTTAVTITGASATSSYSNAYLPAKVFDGSPATYNNGWYSGHGGQAEVNPILTLDLTTARAVNSYKLYGNNDGSLDISPRNWTFEGSNDGSTWTVLDTQTNKTGYNTTYDTFFAATFVNSTAYRYYRFSITAWNTSSSYDYTGVAEVQLYTVTNIAGVGQGGGGGGGSNGTTLPGAGGGGVGLYGISTSGAAGSTANYHLITSGTVAGTIQVQSSNYNGTTNQADSFIKINTVKVSYNFSRGHTLAVIDPSTLVVDSIRTYDTYGAGNANALRDALANVTQGKIIAIGSFDATAMDSTTRTYLNNNFGGVGNQTWGSARYSEIFIGVKGGTSGTAVEQISSSSGSGAIITQTASVGIGSGAGGKGGSYSLANNVASGQDGTATALISRGGFPGGGAGGTGTVGGGGGALAYKNNITVVPGQTYTVVVGAAGTTTVAGKTSTGGNGAVRIIWTDNLNARGFPSTGVGYLNTQPLYQAGAGAGGGAAGGTASNNVGAITIGGAGGGTQIFGLGASGTAQTYASTAIGAGGSGGSGGQEGKNSSVLVQGGPNIQSRTVYTSQGGFPGGGGGGFYGGRGGGGGGTAWKNDISVTPGQSYLVRVGQGGVSTSGDYTSKGGNGAVRIIYPGDTRGFPSTNAGIVTVPQTEMGWGVDLNSRGQLVAYASQGEKITGSRVVTDGQWHHFALVRSGDRDVRLYVDGKLDAQGTQNFVVDSTLNLLIGAQNYQGKLQRYYNGYLSNIRIQRGVAEYLSDFTPHQTNLQKTGKTTLLCFQDPSFKDRSNNLHAIYPFGNAEIRRFSPFQAVTSTGHSVHFDGFGDYIDASGTSNFTLPGDFTIECFTYEGMYREALSTIFEFGDYRNGILLTVRGNAVANPNTEFDLPGDFYINGINFGVISGDQLSPTVGQPSTVGYPAAVNTTVVPLNQWNHWVITRAGSAVKVYINGKVLISCTYSGVINSNHNDLRIGSARHIKGNHFNGYISNFRITRGIAAYNGDVSTVVDRNNSVFFNGSTDYLTVADNVDYYFDNMNFCIEAFMHPTRIPTSGPVTVVSQWNPTTTSYNFKITLETNGSIQYTQKMSDGTTLTLNSHQKHEVITPAKWYHIVVIANGLDVAMYFDGVRVDIAQTGGIGVNSTATVSVGANSDGSSKYEGYISNFRIIRNTIKTPDGGLTVDGRFAPYDMTGDHIVIPHSPLTMLSQTILNMCQATDFSDERGRTVNTEGTPVVVHIGPFGQHKGLGTNLLMPSLQTPKSGLTATSTTSLGNSVHFNGTSDYLTLADNAAWTLGTTNDYTIEFWVNPTTIPGTGAYDVLLAQWSDSGSNSNKSFKVTLSEVTEGKITYTHMTSGGPDVLTSSSTIKANRWTHIVITSSYHGYTWSGRRYVELYVNGVREANSTEINAGYNSTLSLAIGADSDGNHKFTGYLSNLRFVNGAAADVYRYGWSSHLYYYWGWDTAPAKIAVPKAPLQAGTHTQLLTMGSTRIADSGPNKFTITTHGTPTVATYSPFGHSLVYSSYFDGVGDYLKADAALAGFTTATNNFTVEFYWYQDAPLDNQPAPFGITDKAGGESMAVLTLQADVMRFNNVVYTHGITFERNKWQHVAITYDGSVARIYKDGVLKYSTPSGISFSGTKMSASNLSIGARFYAADGTNGTQPGNFVHGYISNFRIVNKVVYSGTSYAVPLEPLAITQNANPRANVAVITGSMTQLLTCQGETMTDYSNNGVTVTATGDVIERNFSPFSFSKMYSTQFNGANYLRCDSSLSDFGKGTEPFTLEFWWYNTSSIGLNTLSPFGIASAAVSASTPAYNLTMTETNVWIKGTQYAHGMTFDKDQWNHLAFTYDGNFMKIYKNGTLAFTSTIVDFVPFYQCTLAIGARFAGSDGGTPQNYITGYISNFRVTHKVVYTGNFKLPSEPMYATQNQGTNIAAIGQHECTLLTCQSEAIVDNSDPSDRVLTFGTNKPVPAATSPYDLVAGVNQSIFALAGEAGNGGGSTGTILLTCHDKTLYDGSVSSRTIKPYGDAHTSSYSAYAQGKDAQLSPIAPFSSGTTPSHSVYLDGVGDYIELPDSPYLELKDSDFTMEMWINRDPKNTNTYAGLWSKRATSNTYGPYVLYLYNNVLYVAISTNGSTWQISKSTGFAIAANIWYHVAVTRTSNKLRIFVNGVLVSTDTLTGSLVDNNSPLTVGACSADGAWDFTGYISNFRLIKGKSLYDAQFKVPSSPLTAVSGTVALVLQHKNFLDDSGYHWNVTPFGNAEMNMHSPFATTIVSENHNDYDGAGASTYFDGLTTWFSTTDSEALQVGTQPATVEFWFYPEKQDGIRRVVTSTTGTVGSNSFNIGYYNGKFGVTAADGESRVTIPVTSENYPRLNAWNHVAWVGTEGNKQSLYVNGQRVASVQNTAYNMTESIRYFGGYDSSSNGEYFQGHLTNMRVVIGFALYNDEKFTVAGAPLQNYTSGTGLLAFQNEVVVDHSPNSFDITPHGTTSPRHFSPFQLEDVQLKAAPKDTLITNGGVGGNGGLYGGGGGGNGGTVGTHGTSGAGAGATEKTSAVNGVTGTGAGGGGGWHQGSNKVFGWLGNQAVGNKDNNSTARSGGGHGATANIYTQTSNGTQAGPGGGGGGSAGAQGYGGGNGGTYGGGGGGDCDGRFAGTGFGGQGLIVFKYNNSSGDVVTVLLTTVGRSTYTIPANFVSLVSIEAIGAGGAGSFGKTFGTGGGGGAYAMSTSVAGLTPGRVCYYRVGSGGIPASGTGYLPDTAISAKESWFCTEGPSIGLIDTVPLNTTQGVLADYGRNGAGLIVGYGGSAALSIGDVRYSGGRGGASLAYESAGGGGGAAGPAGEGGKGGDGASQPNHSGGGGGGANGGGIGLNGQLLNGGAGGNGYTVQGVIGGIGAQGIILFNYYKVGDFAPQTIFITDTRQRTFTVPDNFLRLISIECIGAGGHGAVANNRASANGGGGGAYAKTTNVPTLTAGRTCYVVVGSDYGYGRDTWFNSLLNVPPTNVNAGALAKGGRDGTPDAIGLGGTAAASIGEVKYTGGNSGKATVNLGASGGGGAAGPNGDGQVGGDSYQTFSVFVPTSGGGGGGSNGGGKGGIGLVDAGGPGGGGDVNQNANGENGSETIVEYQGVTLVAGGGRGGQFNNSQPGLGGTGLGGDVNSRGGAGHGAKGDTGGAGGGAVGGGTALTNPTTAGDPGSPAQDVSNLSTALRLLGVNFLSNSAGRGAPTGTAATANKNNGGNALQFGAGGGGAGGYGGNGGNGLYGGGGGGAAGFNDLQHGGSGGNGVIVAQFQDAAPGQANVAIITTGTSYTVPPGTTAVKLWAVGGGGGGAGASASAATAGGGGGAGALVVKTFNNTTNLSGNFFTATGTTGTSVGFGGTSVFPADTLNNGRPGSLIATDGSAGKYGGGGAGGFAANAQQVQYAGTAGGDGYVKLTITNYAAPSVEMPTIAERHALFSSDSSNVLIRAAHVNNMYQNLVGWAGSNHTHDVPDEY